MKFSHCFEHVGEETSIEMTLCLFEVIKGRVSEGSIPAEAAGKLHGTLYLSE